MLTCPRGGSIPSCHVSSIPSQALSRVQVRVATHTQSLSRTRNLRRLREFLPTLIPSQTHKNTKDLSPTSCPALVKLVPCTSDPIETHMTHYRINITPTRNPCIHRPTPSLCSSNTRFCCSLSPHAYCLFSNGKETSAPLRLSPVLR